ncbi:MAG: ATP-binding protein [Thermodesulfobacteriota bacterium]
MLSHFTTRAERVTFLGLAALLLGLCGLTVASAATQIGRTWPGFVVWRNLVAPAIGGPGWPGGEARIPQRRVVASVDGVDIESAYDLREHVRSEPVGALHEFTFHRSGPDDRIAVRSALLAWRDVLPVYLPYWVDGFAFFATGLVVFYFRPGLAAARAALALGVILGTVLLLASDVFSAFWLDRLYFACESLTPGALLHLALCFPEARGIVRRRPWLEWAVYLPFVPLAALQIAFLTGQPGSHLVVNDLVYTAIAGAGLVTVASLVDTFWTSRSALARQQAKIVMAGVVLAAFVPSIGILSIVLLGAAVPMNLLAPFFLVFPLSVGYAIARHDLFSVDRYLRTGVVYAALSLIVSLSWAGLVLAGEAWLGAGGLPRAVVPLYVLVVLAVFDPLRAAIQDAVDRLFYRQAYSYRATVEATSRMLASVLDTERVADTVLRTLTDVMAIDWAVLVVLDGRTGERRSFGLPATAAERDLGDVPAALAEATRGPVSRYAADGRGGAAARASAVLLRSGASLLVPMRFEGTPVGLLLLGDKRSGAFYTDDDLHLLETLAHQSALALTNARAYEIIRRTQAELVEAERLAAVGELASTVAHGIRNPLAGIRAAAQVAREDVAPDSPMAESLDDIIAEADRLEARVRSILELARPAASEHVRCDVAELLRSHASSLGSRVPPRIALVLDVAPGLPPAAADRTQLVETLDILVVNAVEAMRGAGRITLRAWLDDGPGHAPRVALSVADDGPGIEGERVDRVFDLFYTTKPAGTGVGLAMAKRLVERHGGTIEVASTPGVGTTFTVRLPLAPVAPAPAEAVPASRAS